MVTEHNNSDKSWHEPPGERASRRYERIRYSAQYLSMRDGVKLALDLYVPEGMSSDEKVPTILHQTRYHRSMQMRWPFRCALGGKPLDHTRLFAQRRKRFVRHGYAWVDVDVRGSGASFGTRICPWSPDEIRDGAEVVDWIIRQPWSNGRVGALGISYSGTTAEFLLANHHPAVKAIAPRFSLFDAYTDIAFPGGIHASWFSAEWHRMNDALDRNAPHEIAGSWVKLFVTGVQPADEDPDRSMRAEAIRNHVGNYNVHVEASSMTYRDDVSPADRFHRGEGSLDELVAPPRESSGSIGLFSPHNYSDQIEAAGAAIYSYSGWFDGGYAHAAIKRHLNVRTAGCRLVLGPWNHGGGWHIDPRRTPKASQFDHDGELLRFFDHHLVGAGTAIAREKPVHYYTIVEGRWKAADCWPPPGSKVVNYYFGADGCLTRSAPTVTEAYDAYRVDYAAASGAHTRWRHQIVADGKVKYTDRKAQDERLLVFDSAPLEQEIEVTGHPIITLFLSSTHRDGNFIVYLEDIDEHGRVSYVTEGLLRAIHRRLADSEPPHRQPVPYRTFKREDARPLVPGEVAKIVFDLLPTSYLFLSGHRLRVALAGADASHFATPSDEPPTLQFHRDSTRPSHIELPVMVGGP